MKPRSCCFPAARGRNGCSRAATGPGLKLILRGKRFGFSLEEIRQLLDLYDLGDQQNTQLRQTYELASQRLAEMERQRAELDANISELKEQLKWGEKMIASMSAPKKAAE